MKEIVYRLKRLPKKFFIIGLILLAVMGGLIVFPKGPQTKPEIVTVEREDLKVTISASGVLSGKDKIDLKFQTGGKVSQIFVLAGDKIYQGQILASLDNREEVISLQQAQNTLRDKQAQVDKTLDDIHLFQYGMGGFANIATANETQTQRQQRTTAEVAKDNAYDAVKLAQKNLGDTLITSPIQGIITEVKAVVGQTVGASDIILSLADISKIYFDAEIDEADIGRVKIGLEAEVNLDAYQSQVFKGTIDQIIPQTKTTSTGTKVVLARILLSNPNFDFINDLSGQATINISEAKQVLTIPLEALTDSNIVLIQTDQDIKSKQVVIGIQSEEDVEIKEGLNEGDQVILTPQAMTPKRGGLLGIFR